MMPDPKANPVCDEFFLAMEKLGPVDLRVLHLLIERTAELETAGYGEQADALLTGFLDMLRPGARQRARHGHEHR